MIRFIRSEAAEKANEIKNDAAEQCIIDRSAVYEAEKANLEAEFDRKHKQVDVNRRILRSNVINASRLEVLERRNKEIVKIFERAREGLKAYGSGAAYEGLLSNLMLEALLKLSERSVQLNVRQCDIALAKKLLPNVITAYRAKLPAGETIDVKVDEKHFLLPGPSEVKAGEAFCCGGVIASAKKGKILCSNTLDARLEIAFGNLLPDIRIGLFGASTARQAAY
eukprot:c5548_g1_i1.p2 GENE.c5548_g1_i1~~c5548_g1_i1.p2  ORF type:complete len:254 (+),score=55.44 c5548_g1_i1:91-762(+)